MEIFFIYSSILYLLLKRGGIYRRKTKINLQGLSFHEVTLENWTIPQNIRKKEVKSQNNPKKELIFMCLSEKQSMDWNLKIADYFGLKPDLNGDYFVILDFSTFMRFNSLYKALKAFKVILDSGVVTFILP